MSILGKFACAAVVLGAVAASPALAVDVEAFANFNQINAAKIFQYRNTADGASLSATGVVNFTPLVATSLGSGGTPIQVDFTLNAVSASAPTSAGQLFSGSLVFTLTSPLAGIGGALSDNALTVNFTDAQLAGFGTAGALVFSTDSAVPMTSGFFDFVNTGIMAEDFALSLVSVTPVTPGATVFDLASGKIADFNANGTGAFSSAPPPVPFAPAVPEPASWALMLLGFGIVGAGLRGRRRSFVAA